MENLKVEKRNGQLEELNYDKIHKVLYWATEGIKGVAVTDIEVNAKLFIKDGIKTSDIHKVLIDSAAELISVDNPNYQIVAARLLMHLLRKDVFGTVKNIPTLKELIEQNVKAGIYDKNLLRYDDEELDTLNDFIKHERDFELQYAGAKQLLDKYLIQDRSNHKFFETPQFAFMLQGMIFFQDYPQEKRIQYVRKFYNAASRFKINLPTPVMCGVRTPNRQWSSCTLIDIGDDLDSIVYSDAAVTFYTAKRAGIGLNAGRIRAVGSKIRGGEVVHTGVIPFLKKLTSSTRCCTQNGVRGGNATTHYPYWHLEVEELLVLKNNKGTEDNRVRTMDYSIQFNKTFFKRVQNNGDITLFSPHEVPELYEAFAGDADEFEKLYIKYEGDESLRKRKVKAMDLFKSFCQERIETGRIYTMNIDHCNTHSSFNDKIFMSNLCQEITLPTKPIHNMHKASDDQEIALCVLAGVNMGNTKVNELPGVCDLIVRALDYIIEYQDYPVIHAEHMKKRRSIGVGLTNLAYFLARKKMPYGSPDALEQVDTYVEAYQYALLKASNNLAKEKGACEWFNKTKYAKGILPIDTYHKGVDDVVKHNPKQDWESLRASIKEFGLANSTLTAIMPAESSAIVSGATNGIEPPRELLSYKKSKKAKLPIIVPEADRLKKYYTLAFDMESNEGYIKTCAVIQKWIDQAISANTYYSPLRYEDGNLPLSIVMKDIFLHYSLGGKTLYYANTDDGRKEDEEKESTGAEQGCDSGACTI